MSIVALSEMLGATVRDRALMGESQRTVLQRYGVLPTRNQKVNSQLAALVKRIGVDEAPNIAAFYLSHNRKLYVNSHHCTDLLLRDAEALRTEWLTGHKVTEWGARETDRLQTASDAVARVAKKLGAL